MAIVSQPYLFSWKNCDELGDLERLQAVIENIPDQKLISALTKHRGKGRNDYPIVPMWNSILAGVVFQHKGVESLRRELKRNAQMREICGFNPIKGSSAIPSSSAYSRFFATLLKHEDLINEIFLSLVSLLETVLPNFGKNLAFDGKAIKSLSKGAKGSDRRGEDEADWGIKSYKGVDKEGNRWEKTKKWFGFRLHLINDADYEIPIAFQLTKASVSEQPVIREMFAELARTHSRIIENCEHAAGDRGYDSTQMIVDLWEKYGIKPIIGIRNMWKDEDKTRQLKTRDIDNVTYNYKGEVFCHCPATGEARRMSDSGFEKDREALKFACPAKYYGIRCQGARECPLFNKSLRIPLREDRRIFTPVSRSSYKWQRLYNTRTSVERINSRIDGSFGFEKHYIRGLKKMRVKCGLALCVMLAIALARAKDGELSRIRSLVA